MCRWGCQTTNTSFMCKWCGTRYCKDCLKGAFTGNMKGPATCRVCNQPKCQGQRVDYVPGAKNPAGVKGQKSAGRSRSQTKSAKSSESKSGSKTKKGAKKKGKKKKKEK